MNTVLDFIGRHWFLVALFVIAFIWLIFEESRHQGLGGTRQTPQGVTALINHENAIVVDLRDSNAFKDGHITGSLNVPYKQLDQNMTKLEKHKQKPLVLVCAMGQHSTQAMNKLKRQGFSQIYVLGGGVSAWKKDNLPLVKVRS